MTYIEFFDPAASENISACLSYAPARVIYIGDDSKQIKRHIANYARVFSARGQDIEFLFKTVSKSNFSNVVTLLTELVETYDDCVFDLSGGDEVLILALGYVQAQHPDRNIQIHRFNLRNNAIYDYDMDGNTVYRETPTLSVEENVRIYGGDVVCGDVFEEKTYAWDLTEEFMEDFEQIWDICKENVKLWNIQLGMFAAAEELGTKSEDGLTVAANISDIDEYLQRFKSYYKPVVIILQSLLNAGLLVGYSENGQTMTVSYKNAQVKRCLIKAGQALELKVYLTAKYLQDHDGTPIYNDAANGVLIDWDGVPHAREDGTFDTENEVDVLLMHNVIPVFISCKSGVVTSAELYKLSVVAERFGDRYAKKVIVATSNALYGEPAEYVRQRARDMQIRLVENADLLDDAEWEKHLKHLWSA